MTGLLAYPEGNDGDAFANALFAITAMNTIREVLEHVAKLSREYDAKHQIHQQEHGTELGVAFGSRKSEHYLQAIGFLDRKLRSYLEGLPEDVLHKLETLVYFGRGDDDDIDALHVHIRSTSPAREDVTRTILAKISALSMYLPCALSRAEELGIDLERPFG